MHLSCVLWLGIYQGLLTPALWWCPSLMDLSGQYPSKWPTIALQIWSSVESKHITAEPRLLNSRIVSFKSHWIRWSVMQQLERFQSLMKKWRETKCNLIVVCPKTLQVIWNMSSVTATHMMWMKNLLADLLSMLYQTKLEVQTQKSLYQTQETPDNFRKHPVTWKGLLIGQFWHHYADSPDAALHNSHIIC